MLDYKREILIKTQSYLKQVIPNFHKRPKINQFSCPSCGKTTCIILPNANYRLDCHGCNWQGDIIDVVRLKEPTLQGATEDEILVFLGQKIGIAVITITDVDTIFKLYSRFGFDMVPVRKHGKNPFETEWQKTCYKLIDEWKKWINDDLNIGVKTGKPSNTTVIDIDCKNVLKSLPKELKPYLEHLDTLKQETENGYHYFFEYEPEIPKSSFDIVIKPDQDPTKTVKYHIDVQNDGGQVVVFPSIVFDDEKGIIGYDRKFNLDNTKLHSIKITKMPAELKTLLLAKCGVKSSTVVTPSVMSGMPDLSVFGTIAQGNRNHALMHLGGILRRELNPLQTEKILELFNSYFVKPPLSLKELQNNIFKPLQKYIKVDENELAKKVLEYMNIVGDATPNDIRVAINFHKYDVDKACELLVREGYLFKKYKSYHLIKRAQWTDKFMKEGDPINFKMPYFDDEVNFRQGDMIIIGAPPGTGKTHIAMNIVKQLVDQGKKPYYISLESGSRFVTIAKALQMGEGDFYQTTLFNPQDVELEKDAITIIDWLLPDDYSQTDKLYKYFAEQLVKQGGILFIFVQLKSFQDTRDFYASNMVKMFPALVVTFAYKKDDQGNDMPDKSFFESVKIRDPKGPWSRFKIHLKYNFQDKTLLLDTVTP